MADITLCSNQSCKLRHKCLRALAEPNPKYQSYAYFECGEDNKWESVLRVNTLYC